MRKKKFIRLVNEFDIKPLESFLEKGMFKIGPYIVEIKEDLNDMVLPELLTQSKLNAYAMLGYLDKPIDKLLLGNILKGDIAELSMTTYILKENSMVVLIQDMREHYSYLFTVSFSLLPTDKLIKNFEKLSSLYKEVISNDVTT